jgi:hypothetical protein
MHKFPIATALILCLIAAGPAIPKTINLPVVSPERAIAIAQEHVRKTKLDISRHFMAKIEYFGLYDEYGRPFWQVEWRLAEGAAKGGQIVVYVYPDETASHTLGE